MFENKEFANNRKRPSNKTPSETKNDFDDDWEDDDDDSEQSAERDVEDAGVDNETRLRRF